MQDPAPRPSPSGEDTFEARLDRLERAHARALEEMERVVAAGSLRADVSRRRLRRHEEDLEAAGGGAWTWRPRQGAPRFSPACHRVLGPERRGLAMGRRPLPALAEASPGGDGSADLRPRLRDTREMCMKRVHPEDLQAFEHELDRFLAGGFDRFFRRVRVLDDAGAWLPVLVAAGVTHSADDGRVSRMAGVVLLCPAELSVGNGGAVADPAAADGATERAVANEKALAERREELAALARLASHDLRSPLRTIMGFSEHLDGLVRADADAADAVARIRRAGDRLVALVDRVTVYASLGRGPRRDAEVDLNRTAADALRRLERHVEGSGAVVHVHPLPRVRGDPGMLVHVFEQLLDNGIRFAGGKPPVVHVDSEEVEDAGDSEGSDASGDSGTSGGSGGSGEVRIRFTDGGVGFDPAMAEAMFEPYRSHDGGDPSRPGTGGAGLGLTIARRAVERHGGSISALSAPLGKGSRFVVTLPRHPPAEA